MIILLNLEIPNCNIFNSSQEIKDKSKSHTFKEKELEKYVILGKLGEAFKFSFENHLRPIVLIDEIDKADIDFPNDLLLELDELRFSITELDKNKERKADRDNPPIVIITSNDEKDLPEAFLRRCVYHYIQFPNNTDLKKIINHHFQQKADLDKEEIKKAIDFFEKVRKAIINAPQNVKAPSTSELVDWFQILVANNEVKGFDEENHDKLIKEIPYHWALIKGIKKSKRIC